MDTYFPATQESQPLYVQSGWDSMLAHWQPNSPCPQQFGLFSSHMRQSIMLLESKDGSMQESRMSKKGKRDSRRENHRKPYVNHEGK